MKFFLDTANLDQIRQGVELGVIDGVTTNPSLMAKEGVSGSQDIAQHYVTICEMVGPGADVSAEVLSTDFEQMMVEGRALAALHPNIVVKVPCTRDGIRAIKCFDDEGIRTNCTLIFTIGQALLAAKAGASYVSPFVGRLDDIASDGIQLVNDIVDVFDTYNMSTEVLAASIRSTQHIIQCLGAGAHVATCPLSAILGLLNHPLTDKGLAIFAEATKKLQ
ncbi:MAG: fructose-6-phosphate aldolase [Mucinivorans sp.]